MNNLQLFDPFDQFDILFRNLLDGKESLFHFAFEKINYPVDIYETEKGLMIELAIVGISSDDINIEVDGDLLRIKYQSPKDEKKYIQKNISKKSFDFSWKVSSKFDLQNLEATTDKGLLKIEVPHSKTEIRKKIQIKPKNLISNKD